MGPRRLAVFASGGGSNFQAILDAHERGELELTPVCLVVDRSEIGALSRARNAGLPAARFPASTWRGDPQSVKQLLAFLTEHQVEAIALCGFLRKLPQELLQAYPRRILNIHPALLPAFGGKGMYGERVHQAVWRAGCKVSGATVHLVNENYDEGPILLQEAVPLAAGDTPAQIAARVLQVEHRLFPAALQILATNELEIDDQRVNLCPRP